MDQPSPISQSTRETAQALFAKAMRREDIRRQWRRDRPQSVTIGVRSLCGLLLLTIVATSFSTGLVLSKFGGGLASGSSSPPTMAVYIHRKTGKIVRVSPEESRNDPTLGRGVGFVPARWCPKCERWFPGPTQDDLARIPLGIVICPQDRRTVLKAGP